MPEPLTPAEVANLEHWHPHEHADCVATIRSAWAERDRNDTERVDANWRERRARRWAKAWKAAAKAWKEAKSEGTSSLEDLMAIRDMRIRAEAAEAEFAAARAEVERLTALVERHREDSKP